MEADIELVRHIMVEAEADDGEWVRSDLEEHVRDEHSTFTWLLEPMMERTGFRIEQARLVAKYGAMPHRRLRAGS